MENVSKKAVSLMKQKKNATGAIGYVFLFMTVLILVIVTLYLAQVAKLMTHQHHVDDSLADSVLASLVADDIYYFETYESTGTPVVRFKNVDDLMPYLWIA
jgi:competence protein ComGC